MNRQGSVDFKGRGDSILEAGGFALAGQLLDDLEQNIAVEDFGPYHMERLLGRGGMGEVYLAHDKVADRQVAIKFLSASWPGLDLRRRFTKEVKTLARLEHPLIARLYDAGIHAESTPYFVMEYVDGVPLDVYCRERGLSIGQRLHLFRSVCEAVQYAHGRLILHLDLKPANILVTADGTPKLLDFGIAKELEAVEQAASQTQTGLLCTPAFAAPEQFRREPVTVHTDVYSLGVILYKLLSGVLPFDVAHCTPTEAGMIITGEKEADKPSVAARRPHDGETTGVLPEVGRTEWSDLDVLCLKALKKDVNRRYSSVAELTQDIDRYLKGEPLKARPDSLAYRVRKFLARHRQPVLAAALTVALIVALTLFFTVRLSRARDAALAEAARTRRIQQFMLSMFGDDDQQAAPSSETRVLAVLQRGEQEAKAFSADPATQAEIYETLGRIHTQLGNLQQADQLLQLGLTQIRGEFGDRDSRTAAALMQLGLLRGDQGQVKDAIKLVSEALAVAQRVSPPNPLLEADMRTSLGRVFMLGGENEKAIEILTPLVSHTPNGEEETVIYLESLTALANAEYNTGRFAESLTHHTQALELDRKRKGNMHPRVATDLANIGTLAASQSDYPKAEQLYREAAGIMSAFYSPAHPHTIQLKSFVARMLIMQHKDAGAAALLQEVLPAQEATYGKDHPNVAVTLDSLGRLAKNRGDLHAAELDFERAYTIQRAVQGPVAAHTTLEAANLGEVLVDQKQFARAEKLLQQNIDALTANPPALQIPLGIVQMVLGRAMLEQRKYPESEQHLLSAYSILKSRPEGAARLKQVREYLGTLYDALKQPEKAAEFRAPLAATPGAAAAAKQSKAE